MTELPAVSCAVDVNVDPDTAFTAFTDEMDNWWMRTAITFYDSARGCAPVRTGSRRPHPRGVRRRDR